MSLPVVVFAIVAAITVVSAVGVVTSRDVVRMAAWLLFTLIGVSLTYFLLGAEFVGTAQLIVYVGGTLVLLVFGVMLTAQGPLRALHTRPAEWVLGGLVGLLLFGLLIDVSFRIALPSDGEGALPGTAQLGLGFLGLPESAPKGSLGGLPPGVFLPRAPTAYLLPFEIVSVHLLVVLVGAAYLARAKRKRPDSL